MKKAQTGEDRSAEVLWREEEKTLTLEGEPVLEYRISWPELQGAGRGGTKVNRYYRFLVKSWKERWEREVYWKACLDLTQRRASSRPFFPWKGQLEGEVTDWREDLLSIRMVGREVRGDRPANQVRWGDVWQVREGAPCPLHALLGQGRTWKKRLISRLTELGRERQATCDCFLRADWEQGLRIYFPEEDFCLTSDGIELAYPQGTIAPAAEGTPVFQLPLSPASDRPAPTAQTPTPK